MTRSGIKVAVLGGGSWGSTVASLAAANADTVLWARNSDTAHEVNTEHTNSQYLGDLRLHPALRASDSLHDVLAGADVVVAGIPSHAMRQVLTDAAPSIRPWIPILSLTKGLEQGTNLRMTQVIEEILPGHPVGILAGPNLAKEVLAGLAAAAVMAMTDERVASSLQVLFSSKRFRVYTNTDVLGSEMGGCLKNVIAISAGMAEGLGVGDNTRAMVITRGLAEMARLGVAMGGDLQTFAGLTGMGDLMATCMSPLSRNRQVGEQLARGRTIDEVVADMNMVAEGVKAASVVMRFAEQYDVQMPICAEVDAVVNAGSSAVAAFRGLQRVTATSEIHGVV